MDNMNLMDFFLYPNHNKIFLRRKNKMLLNGGSSDLPLPYMTSIVKNLETLGYTLSLEIIEILKTLDVNQLEYFYHNLVVELKTLTGADKVFQPMYQNFPQEVMEMDEAQLYWNAILHYFGDLHGVRILPKSEKKERLPLYTKAKPNIIELGQIDDFHQMFLELMLSKSSISQQDYTDLAWYIEAYKEKMILPLEFNFKEIMVYVIDQIIQHVSLEKLNQKKLGAYFKTNTDVLRLAVSLSGGDVSLAVPSHFKSFTRKERRLLLSLLNDINRIEISNDLFTHKIKWIRLGERLHPGEKKYKKKYPHAFKIFDHVRRNIKIPTINSIIEKFLLKKDVGLVCLFLKNYPGMFARRIDHILRICNTESEQEFVIKVFRDISKNIPIKILLQLIAFFSGRFETISDIRVFFPKGSLSKIKAIPNTLKPLPFSVCVDLISICNDSIIAIYQERNKLNNIEPVEGKVFIDDILTNMVVPLQQRSASNSIRTTPRGSKFKLPDGDIVRFFIWWKNQATYPHRVDIDLSAVILDNEFQYVDHISYTNLRNRKRWSISQSEVDSITHSGDLTSAPNGACEFIDIDINKILNQGSKAPRYVIMSVFSFTNQAYSTLDECFAGWMMRKNGQSGEIFEPQTVQERFDLVGDSKISIPLIIDLQGRMVYWADMYLQNNLTHSNNIEGNLSNLSLMTKSIIERRYPNLYNLFVRYVLAREMEITSNPKEADHIYALDERKGIGITAFDTETILSEFL